MRVHDDAPQAPVCPETFCVRDDTYGKKERKKILSGRHYSALAENVPQTAPFCDAHNTLFGRSKRQLRRRRTTITVHGRFPVPRGGDGFLRQLIFRSTSLGRPDGVGPGRRIVDTLQCLYNARRTRPQTRFLDVLTPLSRRPGNRS